MSDWYERAVKLWERVTLTMVLLGILAIFSGIFLIWVYEQRDAVFITVTGSPLALLVIAGVMVLVCLVWVAYMFVAMHDRANQKTLEEMRQRIAAAELVSARQDKEIDRLHTVLDDVGKQHVECERRVQQLIGVMNSHGINERRHLANEAETPK